jgi:tripartite-type tricarboxylate transporter receptor subunit TctC
VSTAKRSPVLPDVPTVAEAALPGFDFDQWYGLLAPAKTPKPILEQLSKEVARILDLPDVRERFQSQGAVAKPSTPQQFDAFIRTEIDKLGKIIKAAGARAD